MKWKNCEVVCGNEVVDYHEMIGIYMDKYLGAKKNSRIMLEVDYQNRNIRTENNVATY